jgi:hypothetical protein
LNVERRTLPPGPWDVGARRRTSIHSPRSAIRDQPACYDRDTTQEAPVDPPTSSTVSSSVRITSIVCAAILMSLPVYVAVAYFTTSGGTRPAGPSLPAGGRWVLVALAIGVLAAAQVVWSRLLRAASAKPTQDERLAAFRTAATLTFALREAAGIVGLVVTMLTGELLWCLVLCGAAAAAMLLGWPRRTDAARLVADPETRPIG